jgi:putative endonuclease
VAQTPLRGRGPFSRSFVPHFPFRLPRVTLFVTHVGQSGIAGRAGIQNIAPAMRTPRPQPWTLAGRWRGHPALSHPLRKVPCMARHLDTGRRGEELVAHTYEQLGYAVLARNWRAGRTGELDLVASRGRSLVVCEVKTRSSTRYGSPAEAVDWRKQRRLRRLAAQFITAFELRPTIVRFDVACVIGREVQLIEAAF